jgi:hypothetical protein
VSDDPTVVVFAALARSSAVRPSARFGGAPVLLAAPVGVCGVERSTTALSDATRLLATVVRLAAILGAASLIAALQHECL